MVIPNTLQALFTARLDGLDESSRHTLQLASVIGRSFSEPVLRAVSGADDLSTALRTLERLGLIAETARTPEREYAFHHSLTQDATYGTILLRRRRELHRRVGEVFEELYADRVDEFAPLLAHHFREAGDHERTLRYATFAAENAARLYANAEAASQYATAIEAADRLDRTTESINHLYPKRGRVLELSGRYDEAVANYEEMTSLARDSADRGGMLAAEMALTTLYATPTPLFDATRGRELAERTIALAQELSDRPAESKGLWNLMILDVYGGGDPREAIDAGVRSLAIARELNDRQQIAFTLNDLWRPYASVGEIDASRACLDEARPLWREMGNLPMLCENLSGTAALLALAGDGKEALSLYEEAYAIAREIVNPWGQAHSLFNAYLIDLEQGNVGRAMDRMRECIQLAEQAGFVIPQSATRADLGALFARLGQVERGKELADQGLEVAREQTPLAAPMVLVKKAEIFLLAGEFEAAESSLAQADVGRLPGPIRGAAAAEVDILRGQLAAAQGDPARAVDIAIEVLERLRRLGMRQFVPEALLLQGASLVALERWSEAEHVLREASSEAEVLGYRMVLWQIVRELARVRAATGDEQDASRLRERAGTIVLEIASTIDDEPLRESFLKRPEVAAVLPGR